MNRSTLIPSVAEVELICLRQKAGVIQVELRAHQPSSLCPSCGCCSSRVHSRYWRTIADLPWEGIPVKILLQARKFFCGDERCSRRIFTEQLPKTVARYARRSCRSSDALSCVTLALGGRAVHGWRTNWGCWPADRHCFGSCASEHVPPSSSEPRVIGIDEWAWKKGHRYGTILCDLERRRVIDLLPNRSTETVAAWLRQHPGVQVVSRDRASSFADAISKGAPEAVQVPDRWHLLNNLVETLGRSLERHRPTIVEVAKRVNHKCATPPSFTEEPATPGVQRTRQNRERRLARYQEFRNLVETGMNYSEASQHLGIPLRTMQRWVACGVGDCCPRPHDARSIRHHPQGDAAAWPGWLEAAEHSPYAPFVRSLRRDQDAVAAALQLSWSNGMVEGQIHPLKLIKRQMYGRAGFDLLSTRPEFKAEDANANSVTCFTKSKPEPT